MYSIMNYVSYCLVIVFNIREITSYITTCEPVISLDNDAVVKIPGFATFRGSFTISHKKNRTIHQYLGIPFAVPPMGPLRFKPPVPWNSLNQDVVYDAKYFKRKCPQLVNTEDYAYLEKNNGTAEDCLYLNVFTLVDIKKHEGPLLPVMVYIHGGGYYQGSALDFCPNYLLDHNIVLVTLQYRLGPLGFLNLGTDDIAGNMGLLDQLQAIEWVNKYIKYFGGDSNRVTLVGASSGALSVSLMLVSPLARTGLFHQVIAQSGSFFGDWGMDHNSVKHGLEFAKYVNCAQTDRTQVKECLLNVSSFDLIQANKKYMNDRINSTQQVRNEIGIAHVVIQTAGTKKFLVEDPIESVKKGNFSKIPTIIGCTEDEGSMVIEGFVDYVLKPKFKRLDTVTESLAQYLKTNLFYDFVKYCGASDDEMYNIELAEETYLPSNKLSSFNETIPGLVDLSGALIFKSKQLKFARLMMPHAFTYLYSFNFKGTKTKLGYGIIPDHIYFDGVAHSDDLIYLFPYNGSFVNDKEEKMSDIMTGLWTSFIINGGKYISTPELEKWPLMSTSVGPYLKITTELAANENFLEEYTNHVRKPNLGSVFVPHGCIFFAVLSYFVIFII